MTGAAVYNLAGQRAERKVEGPGHFQTQFIDELYKATAEEIAVMSEIEVCDLIVEEYTVVYSEQEEIGLVANIEIDEYNKLLNRICR